MYYSVKIKMLSGLPGLRLTCKASSIFFVPQKLIDFRGQIKKIHGIEKKEKKKKKRETKDDVS